MGFTCFLNRVRTRENMAWAAGFFDGEGSFWSNVRNDASDGVRAITASVTNTDRELLDKFQSIVGLGKVRGPYQEQRGNRQPVYRWSVGGHRAVQAVGAMMWEWLGTYKRQRWAEALTTWRAGVRPNAIELKRAQTHCKWGHPLSGDNLRFNGRQRMCRTCDRRRSAESKARKRAREAGSGS